MLIRSYILLTLLIICVKLISCKSDSSGANDYLIDVDSIHAPDSVIANTEFDVAFFGIAGLNSCQHFKTFNIGYNKNDIIIEAWGTDERNEHPCGEAIEYLNGHKVTLKLFPQGFYRLLISEPNATTLVKQILVK